MALSVGCDESVGGGGASSESTVCSTVGTSWWNQPFSDQTGTFHVEFSATPSRKNIDAVVGLSNGSATAWTKLAAIVRFNPDGFIDARNGSAYTAVQSWPYVAGETFFIRIEVDVAQRTYSAWASHEQGSYGSWNQIAANYAFRTEQASVTHLNDLAGFVNTTTPGSLQVCGLVVNAGTSGNGCVASTAGKGFVNVAVTPGLHGMVVTADATPSTANMDGVVGIASGTVDDYNDFAASVRFFTNGHVEVRDGDAYAASAVSYTAGQTFSLKFLIDLEARTYTVFSYVQGSGGAPQVLAENVHFRSQQAGVTQLDHVATIVASPTGSVNVCQALTASPASLRYAKFGSPRLAPSGTNVIEWGLNTGNNETQKWDSNGKFLGSPGFAIGGEPAVDASGNLYLAYFTAPQDGNFYLNVDSYTADFTTVRWKSKIAVDTTEGSTLYKAAVSGDRVLVLVRHPSSALIESFATANGTASTLATIPDDGSKIIGIGKGGWAIASRRTNPDGSSAGYAIEQDSPTAGRRWTSNFDGWYDLSAIAVAQDGSVVFGGAFHGASINFGDRTLYAGGNNEEGPFNAFFVALSSTGALRYSMQTGGNEIQDLDTDGSYIAVSNYHFTQVPWVHWGVYDVAGNGVAGCSECDVGLGHQGFARNIWLANHRVYLNVDEILWWPPTEDGSQRPFMFAWDF